MQSNKYFPIPHCSCCFGFVGRKALGCDSSSRETDKSLSASMTSGHKFSSHAQDLFQCLQLCLWHCVTARLQLLRERSFSHICQLCPVQYADLGNTSMSLPSHTLVVSASQLHLQLLFLIPTQNFYCFSFPFIAFLNAFAIFSSNIVDAALSWNCFLYTFLWIKWSNKHKLVW